MEDRARRQNGQGNLAAIEKGSQDGHFTSELARVRCTHQGDCGRGRGLIEKGHDHHEREANANRQTTPRWHRQKLDEANYDRPDGQWPAFLKRRRIL